MKFLYLIIDFASLIVPLIFSFHPKLQFYKKWKQLFPAMVLISIVFISWDIYFTKNGIWGFNPNYLIGIYFFNLPLEEILFFICISYACVFTYHCLNILIKRAVLKQVEKIITILLVVFLLTFGLIYFDRSYTSVTFISLSVLILILQFALKVRWLNRFYFSYLILLIPFTVVNGILTGTGLEEPVVWYNNFENMAIRIGTIPVEDIFYGMLMILLNVAVFEFLAKKNVS